MADPYKSKLVTTNIYKAKRTVHGNIVSILDAHIKGRNLELIHPMSRCVRKHEVCELITVDDPEVGPGKFVQDATYIGFAEMSCSGSLLVGDKVTIAGKEIGVICGFDEVHAPNHINVVIRAEKPVSGVDLGLKIEDPISFEFSG